MTTSNLGVTRPAYAAPSFTAIARRVATTYRDTIQELSEKPTVGARGERMTADDGDDA